MKKAVILLSGGIDSSTTLAIAKFEGYKCFALSFDYSQRHIREIQSAENIAYSIGVEEHLIVDFDLRRFGCSALTSNIDVPKQKIKGRGQKSEVRTQIAENRGQESEVKGQKTEGNYLESSIINHQSSIPITYVPARNTIFLSFALAWAEVLLAEDIFIGANAIDYSGYPDCRPEYLSAYEKMANLATRVSVEGKTKFTIKAPLISMTKSEIIKKGIELGVDYGLTWSCYDPTPKGLPCMRCDSCLFRAKGFKEAGLKDPLI